MAALAFASGQAAVTGAVLNLARAFHCTLPKLGIEVSFVDDPDDLDAWRAAVRPDTKLFFAESPANPRSNVLDIAAVAEVAHAAGVPLVVDNTVPTPYLVRLSVGIEKGQGAICGRLRFFGACHD